MMFLVAAIKERESEKGRGAVLALLDLCWVFEDFDLCCLGFEAFHCSSGKTK